MAKSSAVQGGRTKLVGKTEAWFSKACMGGQSHNHVWKAHVCTRRSASRFYNAIFWRWGILNFGHEAMGYISPLSGCGAPPPPLGGGAVFQTLCEAHSHRTQHTSECRITTTTTTKYMQFTAHVTAFAGPQATPLVPAAAGTSPACSRSLAPSLCLASSRLC